MARSLTALGYEADVRRDPPGDEEQADAAIINLSWTRPGPEELVAKLHASRIPVIAHAGHREKELIELGKAAGADVLATNSELTFKLPQLLEKLLGDR